MVGRFELRGPLGLYSLTTWLEAQTEVEGERVAIHDAAHSELLLRQLLWSDPAARMELRAVLESLDGLTHRRPEQLLSHVARLLTDGRLRLHHRVELMPSDPSQVRDALEYVAPVNEIDDAVWVAWDALDPEPTLALEAEHEPEPMFELSDEIGPHPGLALDSEDEPDPRLDMGHELEPTTGLALDTELEPLETLELEVEEDLASGISTEATLHERTPTTAP